MLERPSLADCRCCWIYMHPRAPVCPAVQPHDPPMPRPGFAATWPLWRTGGSARSRAGNGRDCGSAGKFWGRRVRFFQWRTPGPGRETAVTSEQSYIFRFLTQPRFDFFYHIVYKSNKLRGQYQGPVSYCTSPVVSPSRMR